jgi:hypothetical protein
MNASRPAIFSPGPRCLKCLNFKGKICNFKISPWLLSNTRCWWPPPAWPVIQAGGSHKSNIDYEFIIHSDSICPPNELIPTAVPHLRSRPLPAAHTLARAKTAISAYKSSVEVATPVETYSSFRLYFQVTLSRQKK